MDWIVCETQIIWPQPEFSIQWVCLNMCSLNKFSGDADATGPETTLWEPLSLLSLAFCRSGLSSELWVSKEEDEWVCGEPNEYQALFINLCQREWEQKTKPEMWLWDSNQGATPAAKYRCFSQVLDQKSELVAKGKLFSPLESCN